MINYFNPLYTTLEKKNNECMNSLSASLDWEKVSKLLTGGRRDQKI